MRAIERKKMKIDGWGRRKGKFMVRGVQAPSIIRLLEDATNNNRIPSLKST